MHRYPTTSAKRKLRVSVNHATICILDTDQCHDLNFAIPGRGQPFSPLPWEHERCPKGECGRGTRTWETSDLLDSSGASWSEASAGAGSSALVSSSTIGCCVSSTCTDSVGVSSIFTSPDSCFAYPPGMTKSHSTQKCACDHWNLCANWQHTSASNYCLYIATALE